MRSVILMGMKHSGKSTLGKLLAERRHIPFYDLDEWLVKENPEGPLLNPREISRTLGMEIFRLWEAQAATKIAEALARSPAVLSLGGGTIVNPAAMEALIGRGLKIFLDDDPQSLFHRIMKGGLPSFLSEERPWEDFQRIYGERTALYRQQADRTLDCRGLSVPQALKQLVNLIKE